MSPAVQLALLVIACAASATAGALGWRLRSQPVVEVSRLARDLAERQKALELLIARLESPRGRRLMRNPAALRRDRGEAVPDAAGSALIRVPDLSAAPSPSPAARVSADMTRRFGAIWALADQGASSESIARATGQPVGQVELILGLRHPRGA